jgi:hypothetical protein
LFRGALREAVTGLFAGGRWRRLMRKDERR